MKHLLSLFFTFLMVGTLITGVANADWAYNVVVYDGNSYIPSDVQIDSKQILRLKKITTSSSWQITKASMLGVSTAGEMYHLIFL